MDDRLIGGAREGYEGHNLIFLVGCPRSGTTWLQRLLACHERVKTGQESDLFDEYIGPQMRMWRRGLDAASSGRGGVGLGCYLKTEEFLSILRAYMLRLAEPMIGTLAPGEFFVEKTPSHALYVPEIVELLPKCRIIHLLRDPRDVVASLLSASRSWGKNWAPRSAKAAARMWVKHVQAVARASSVLQKDQFHQVKYEDLSSQPLETLRGVFEFLSLEWQEGEIRDALEKNRASRAKATGGTKIPLSGEFAKVSGGSVVEPKGFVRRAHPGGWREDLSLGQKIWVWIKAGREMDRYGYYWPKPFQHGRPFLGRSTLQPERSTAGIRLT